MGGIAIKTDRQKLNLWQGRLSRNEEAYDDKLVKMDEREELYKGTREIKRTSDEQTVTTAYHVRNVVAEIIEAEIDSTIPQPKVTPKRKEDEPLAKLIEDMLRNELDRLPSEEINDLMERMVPIQGGAYLLCEWDNAIVTNRTIGDIALNVLHPKQVVPQDGITDSIERMDYVILKIPQTKEYIKSRYGVDVKKETEEEPEIRSSDNETGADDVVTQYIAYYRNKAGGIGKYSWVGDTQIEDIEDYQARRIKRCTKCGQPFDPTAQSLPATYDGTYPEGEASPAKDKCSYCGSTSFDTDVDDYEEVFVPIPTRNGEIPGSSLQGTGMFDELGIEIQEQTPTRIPYYKPDLYPLVLRKNVSVYGQLLGDSDVDKIADQQNTIKRLEAAITGKVLSSGSYFMLPENCDIEINDRDMKVWRVDNVADMQKFNVFNAEASIEQDLTYLEQVYQEARQIIGITDSFQGRADTTATSGKAKEFAAAQTAGRLESKRVMKEAAFAKLFELMFKFKLAYADEPRPVITTDDHANPAYERFNRYDFLERDEAGEWVWNDDFLFSCDTAAPLASNREAMWQETRMNLNEGAFGDPTQIDTLILFWTKMETLHYPGAGDTKTYLEEKKAAEQQAMMQQQMMMEQQQMALQQQQIQGDARQRAIQDFAQSRGISAQEAASLIEGR